MTTVDAPVGAQYGSPPSAKVSLATWWEKFKKKPGTKEGGDKDHPPGIFGVPLSKSIKYANVAISLTDANGEQFIYGYIPIVVAKCGVFLKEKATNVEGIFRLSGSAKRIKDLQTIFDSPDKYGKGLDWTGYTVHDAANIFRRYLNQLPEPIIPLDFYARFREPLRAPEHFDTNAAIRSYQHLIGKLPALNRQLLLYILDLLAVFASKSEHNLMNASNLAAIFQPGLINHPEHDMSPGDYKLSQDVLVFLITNQDNFLLGMQGNAENEAIDNLIIPTTSTDPASPRRSKTLIDRSPSTSSAGADDVRRHGNLRRNVSVTSRRSTAGSPVFPSSGGLGRSNTLPSKRPPAVTPVTFRGDYTPTPSSPRGNASEEKISTTGTPPTATAQVLENASHLPAKSGTSGNPAGSTQPRLTTPPRTAPPSLGNNHEDPQAQPQPVTTPTRERNFAQIFGGLSPDSHDRLQRPGNKLRKKQITPNHSAKSSTTTLLEGGNTNTLAQNGYGPPLTSHSVQSIQSVHSGHSIGPPLTAHSVQSVQSAHSTGPPPASHPVGRVSLESVSQSPPVTTTSSMLNYFGASQQGTSSAASSTTLMPAMSPTPSTTSSVTSQGSSHEYSDTTNPSSSPEKKKRSRWRLSGRGFDNPPTSPTFTNGHASTGSLAERIRKVSQSPPHRTRSVSGETSGMSDNEEKRSPFGWLSKKMNGRENNQQYEQERQREERERQQKGHGRTLLRREEMRVQVERPPKSPMPPTPSSPQVQPPTPSGTQAPAPAHERPVELPRERESNSFWRDRQVHYDYPAHSSRSLEKGQINRRGSQPSRRLESQQPRRQEDLRQQPRPEGQKPHRQGEDHQPYRPVSQLPRRSDGQKQHRLESQQSPKQEGQLPRTLASQKPQTQEISQLHKPESQQAYKPEQLPLESQQSQELGGQQANSSETQKSHEAKSPLPLMPEGQQLQEPESQQPNRIESQVPLRLEAQQPQRPENQQLNMPEGQQPNRLEFQQPQMLEDQQPSRLESQQPRTAEFQQPHVSEGQQPLRRGSQQTHKQEIPIPVSELPLYAPIPGESIEPEGRGQGRGQSRRRPQAIRPGETISFERIPDRPISPPDTAL